MNHHSVANRLFHALETLAVALAGAGLFGWLHIPLSWLLGPLTAAMAWRHLRKRPLYASPGLNQFALGLFGYMLGTSFTKTTAVEIIKQLPAMLAATVATVAFSLWMGYWVAKQTRIPVANGIFGSVPGGLTQMLVLSEEVEEVDTTVVAFMQTIRLLSVIFLVPFVCVYGFAGGAMQPTAIPSGAVPRDVPLIAYLGYGVIAWLGYLAGKRIRLPAPILTGPLAATAAALILTGYPAPPLPPLVLVLSQLVIGTHIGMRMQIHSLRDAKRMGLYSLISSAAVVGFSLLIGTAISRWQSTSIASAFLSTAPGGIAEMGLTAKMVHADLAMVSGYQLFRIFFIMFVVPPLLKAWITRQRRTDRLAAPETNSRRRA